MAATLHKVEQAKYWACLKQKHSNPALPARGKAAVEEQMAACLKSMRGPPGKELASMVQAGCEEEVCLGASLSVCVSACSSAAGFHLM